MTEKGIDIIDSKLVPTARHWLESYRLFLTAQCVYRAPLMKMEIMPKSMLQPGRFISVKN